METWNQAEQTTGDLTRCNSYCQFKTNPHATDICADQRYPVYGLYLVRNGGLKNQCICTKLDLSGVMNMQTLVSGYYAPVEINIFLEEPHVCL